MLSTGFEMILSGILHIFHLMEYLTDFMVYPTQGTTEVKRLQMLGYVAEGRGSIPGRASWQLEALSTQQ